MDKAKKSQRLERCLLRVKLNGGEKKLRGRRTRFFKSLTTGRVFLVWLQRDRCRSNHSGFVISCRFAVGVKAAVVVEVAVVTVGAVGASVVDVG